MSGLERYPARGSALLAIGGGAVAVGAVARAPAQTGALLAALLGAVVCWGGLRVRARSSALAGVPVALIGVVACVAGLVLGLTSVVRPGAQLELLPGILGLLVLALGLGPVGRGWERRLVTLGTTFVLLSIVASGLFRAAPAPWLLAGGAATIVAWDAGEQSVSLGEQVGTEASTWSVDLLHTAAAAGVGLLGVVLALSVSRVGVEGLPLGALAMLLGVAVVLTLALYN